MGEFSHKEIPETKPTAPENFRDIKPETLMSDQEANNFWNNEFQKASEEIKETDDNGVKFRDEEKLLPNTKYEVNGYNYETDLQGRIVSAEGKLRIRDADYDRNMETIDKETQDYQDSDQRGHLIAHRFGGSDKLENLVPMDGELNQGDYAKLEGTLADAVKDGADVQLKVEPVYEGESNRPTEFRVSYIIDGDKDVVVFKNGGEESND